jgi:ATP-dependent DNA ligase
VSVRWPVTPIMTRTAAELPVGDRWCSETKFDGFRCIALHRDRVRLRSRQLRPLTAAFPDVVDAMRPLSRPARTRDGELVVLSEARVGFAALQPRAMTRLVEAPAMLVVFELVAHRGDDLRPLPYRERRARLKQLSKPIEYLPVEPTVVVEIETDSCFEVGRYRHPVKLPRVR